MFTRELQVYLLLWGHRYALREYLFVILRPLVKMRQVDVALRELVVRRMAWRPWDLLALKLGSWSLEILMFGLGRRRYGYRKTLLEGRLGRKPRMVRRRNLFARFRIRNFLRMAPLFRIGRMVVAFLTWIRMRRALPWDLCRALVFWKHLACRRKLLFLAFVAPRSTRRVRGRVPTWLTLLEALVRRCFLRRRCRWMRRIRSLARHVWNRFAFREW